MTPESCMITVTHDDIRYGEVSSSGCPVARSLKRHYGTMVLVNSAYYEYWWRGRWIKHPLPSEVTTFIKLFDTNHFPDPITFEGHHALPDDGRRCEARDTALHLGVPNSPGS
jgi:hypothetical protein